MRVQKKYFKKYVNALWVFVENLIWGLLFGIFHELGVFQIK